MNDIFWGVNVSIIILIFLTVKEVWGCSVVDKTTFLIFAAAFLTCAFGVSPAVIIILAALFGIIRNAILQRRAKE